MEISRRTAAPALHQLHSQVHFEHATDYEPYVDRSD